MPHPIRGRTLEQMLRPGWSEFGLPRSDSAGGRHNGFDYYAPPGSPIFATGDGVVTEVTYGGNLGHRIAIAYGGRWTEDCHMQLRSPLDVDAAVNSETVVGYVGRTGNAFDVQWNTAEGPLWHDHHTVWIGGVRVDPIAFYGTATAALSISKFKSEEDDMTFLIRSNQRGHYTASPGAVICHPDTKVTDAIGYRKWAKIMDVADDDLDAFLFALGGCSREQIPAPGTAWYAR